MAFSSSRTTARPDSLLCAALLAAAACGVEPQAPGATGSTTAESASAAEETSGAETSTGQGSTTSADTAVPTSTSPTDTGATSTVDPTEDGTGSSTDGETGALPCGPDGEGPLLNCHIGCPDELFAVAPYVEEFDEQAQYDAHWSGTYAAPTVAGGALNFGPHPMTVDWWDNYSPTWSKEEYGDTLICARLRLTPPMVGVPDEDMFEITVRLPEDAAFETGAMALTLLTAEEKLLFRTRIDEAQWQLHGEGPLPLDRGVENTLDVLIYAQGDEYVAELRNAAHPDEITVLPATAQFSPTGLMTLLGWRNSTALHVDRLVIGSPTAEAQARLVAELP